ncbi:hypothetical protein IFM89_028782 [Coptis chinensis]|uniref:Uncharacterized protein n=1 Tax=Coptis chinensis TaxID=261450 RepID=A0A835H147_9MAGN|nr:hypothetical protein IFM89_028782 [Coptis chinensis]
MFCNKIDLGFILTSLKGLMGCFLGCFRVKDDKKPQFHRISDVNYSKDGDWMSGDNMATLFLSQETDSCSSDHRSTEFPFRDIDGKALKDEAKFLKACGTLLETPAEIQKTSEKVEGSPSHGGDYKNSEFKSWSPITPIRKLHLEDQSDCVPATADIHYEELGHESGSPQVSAIRSIISEEQEAASRKGSEIEIPFLENGVVNLVDNDNVSAVTPVHPSVAIKSKIKSVRFEVQADTEPFSSRSLLSETGAQNVELSDSSGSESGSNKYSYPTPINITDDMQTPGTIYPPSQKNIASGKKSRIRSQYVQSVLKPIDNILQWKTLKKED